MGEGNARGVELLTGCVRYRKSAVLLECSSVLSQLVAVGRGKNVFV